jgi:hypothetical protein
MIPAKGRSPPSCQQSADLTRGNRKMPMPFAPLMVRFVRMMMMIVIA